MAFKLKAGVAATTVHTTGGKRAKSANRIKFEDFAESFKSLHTLWAMMGPQQADLVHRQTLLVELIDNMFDKVPVQFRKVQLNITNCRTIADLEAYQWNMIMAVEGLQLK